LQQESKKFVRVKSIQWHLKNEKLLGIEDDFYLCELIYKIFFGNI
jgi:hypothetical protein